MNNSSLNNPINKEQISYYSCPDYSTAVSRSANVEYTADDNLIILINTNEGGHVNCYVQINGSNVATIGTYINSAAWRNWWFLIPKGSTYKVTAYGYVSYKLLGG